MRIPIFLACLAIGAGPAVAKECRMPDVPPSVPVQLPPECRVTLRPGRAQAVKQDSLRADQGLIDLGNGTKVRVGGRVRAEVGVQP